MSDIEPIVDRVERLEQSILALSGILDVLLAELKSKGVILNGPT